MLKTFAGNTTFNQLKYRKIFLIFLLLFAVTVFTLSGMGDLRFESLHLLLDTTNGILSLMLALFLLAEQSQIEANIRKNLAAGFAFAALTELLHALVGIEWAGEFAWIGTYANMLRPATWSPSNYVLSLALLWAIWLMRRKVVLLPGVFAAG